MKKKSILGLMTILLIALLFSCKSVDVTLLEGTHWLREKDGKMLYFESDKNIVYVYDIFSSAHFTQQSQYNFTIKDEKITLQYAGPYYIYVKPSTHSIKLKNDELTIDFTNGCYGFEKEVYVFTKYIQ